MQRGTGAARRALLIGIGQAPATEGVLEPLDEVVQADLRLMRSALDSAGYEVEVLRDAGLSRIRPKIYEVARDVPEGGTLLLYFTGHGVRIGGTDYLVPADAIPPGDGVWQEPYVDSLLPASISPLLKDCRAGTVLWVIDACRTLTDSDGVAFGNTIDNGPPGGGFAVLTGCSAGERCGHTAEGSFFTRGLADALGPLTPARTVQDVFGAARSRTREAARRHGLTQTADIRYGTNAEAATRETEICSGRPLLEAWQEAARETPLWDRVRPEDKDGVPLLKTRLNDFVEQCARTLHHAQERLPRPDPWADEDFPVRLLRDRLPLVLPGTAALSSVEAALLVAAPFLHEAAWADRLSQAAEIDPYDGRRRPDADAHRRHYEQICDQHARVARKAAQCRARGRVQDEASVVMWLVHRWITDRFETDDETVPAARARALVTALGVDQDRVRELSGLLCGLASGIGLGDLQDDLLSRSPKKVLLPGGHQPLRIRPLWALLRLATCLAVDVRTFPEVVGEHLAVTDPVLPEHVIGVAGRLSWDRDGEALDLDAPCPHQAVHAALSEVVDHADQLAAQVKDLSADLPEAEAALLAAVPTRVTERGLRPRETGSEAPYATPLLRFHLAQTEVRELLMGEQLYGGRPELALRELYQNAMDACRYRAMRWRYLESSGACPTEWTGRITFTQGEDDRGRYVECRDNGVGMSAEQLTHTFTRAGSRFERSQSFRKEQSRWLRHDPSLRLYPNSRFGIGVFSYFMLADEMTIVTRHVSPEGMPAEHALRVDIPSSGSLFRIQRHAGADDGMQQGGTRVRLYLREGAASEGLSCLRVLRELVRVSEFRLTVSEEGGGPPHEWPVGKLESPPGVHVGASLEAVPGVLWWVTGEGAILCDGITTDRKPFGYVLDLKGPHAGQLSVSRNVLQDFDRGWAESVWRAGAGPLAEWPELSLKWVTELESRDVDVPRVLDEEWRGRNVGLHKPDGSSVSLDTVGWFQLDSRLLDPGIPNFGMPEMLPWRLAAQALPTRVESAPRPASLCGHPVPRPGDFDIAQPGARSWRGIVICAERRRLTVAEVLHRRRKLRIVDPDLAPPPLAVPDPDWIPSGLDRRLAEALDGRPRTDGGRNPQVFTGGEADDVAGLVPASMHLSVPLGALARSLNRCHALHSLRIGPTPPHHENYVCTDDDVAFLLERDGPSLDRLRRVTDGWDVREVCRRTGASPSDVLHRLSAFSWLGWSAPSAAEIAPWMDLDDEVADILSRYLMSTPDGSREVSYGATVEFASLVDEDLGTAERRLARIVAELNMTYHPRLADSRAGRTVLSADAVTLVRYLALIEVFLEDGLDPESLVLAQGIWDDFDLTEAVEELKAAGVSVADNIGIAAAWGELPLRSRYVLSGKNASMEDQNQPAPDITHAVLFSAASRLSESLHEARELAAAEAARFRLAIPSLPEGLAGIRPSRHAQAALISHQGNAFSDAGTPEWKPLAAAELATYAHRSAIDSATAYEQLSALRPLGALVPDLPPSTLEALRDRVPDDRDLLALSPAQRLSPVDGPYTALDLVSIAGRLGEPVTETVRRIAPYVPLLPGSEPLPPAPGAIPLWQDLAVLSRHFDGRLPAVGGRVTRSHLGLAAAAVGETEAWVMDRLRIYRTMFDLELDDSE